MKASDFDALFDAGEDVSAYLDLSKGRRLSDLSKVASKSIKPSRHKFQIRKNAAGEYVAYFTYNSETLFWTEGYKDRRSALKAIESFRKNGPAAEVIDAAE
jgi:uncharacterized protein